MNRVFYPYLDKFVIVFIDNTLVYPKDKKQQQEYLKIQVEDTLQGEVVCEVQEKWIWLDRVGSLGHVVTSKGIGADSDKVDAISSWEVPKNASEVLSFLGLAGYYRWFIEGFSKLAMPMIQLTRKSVMFEWNERCKESFQELKRRLTSAPTLTIPDPTKVFVIYSDASKQPL